MASKLNEEKLEKKFQQVSNSQDSIQTLSLWLIYHKSQTKKIVDIWLKTLKKSKVPHRLVLFYVANDVIQTCKRKSAPQFAEVFAEVLAEATLLVRDEKIKANVERVFNVWNQRNVYTTEFVEGLRNILNNSKVQSMQPKFVAEFKPQKVMDKIRKIKKIELESVTKLSAVSSSKLDCSSSEIIYQLKDRTHGHQIVHEYDEAVRCLEDYLQIVEKELAERAQLIELLEKGEIFYNAQNGEVKVVANAYRTFSGRVKGLKKKLDEMYPSLPSPIPSPCSDAPSPTPSEEGPIMSPLSETKEEVKEKTVGSTNTNVAHATEEKKVARESRKEEAKDKLEDKKESLPLLEDAPSPESSPDPFPITTPPSSQPLQSSHTPTPPVTTKPPQQDGIEEQAPGMMTSWLSAFNTNNPTFTKTFSLDSRVPQTGSLESRLSSLMESLPNLPQVFRNSNYEPLIQSAGSTPIRVEQPSISSPVVQTTTYTENQPENGEPGTPVNDENQRDTTPVEDEDTRFSVGNTLPLASVMSSLSNEDLHQSLLKSLSHLQQLSASNTPPPVTQAQVNTTELRNTPVSFSSTFPAPPEDYSQTTTAPFTKADTSFSSSLQNIPSYLRSPFNLSDIQNAPSIFSAASKLSFPSLSLQPPSPNEDITKAFSSLGSPPQVYSYATNSKDEIHTTAPPMQTDQNYNKQDFNTEEENLEPMDMDLDESDEEENCSNIIEGMPPGSSDVDLRVPPVPQKITPNPITWSSCITSDVAALIPPPSHSDASARPELPVTASSDAHALESLTSQHLPVKDAQHFNQKDSVADHKIFKSDMPDFSQRCYNDEDLRHHNIENTRHQNIDTVTHHHLEGMSPRYNDVRRHSIDDVRRHSDDRRHHSIDEGNIDDVMHHTISDGRHHSIDDGRHQNINDGRHHSIDDGRHHSIDDGRHHSISDGRHHSVDDGRHHNIDDGRRHSVESGRQLSVDDGRHQNIDDGRHHSISDGRIHSVDADNHHTVDDVSRHIVEDASHHNVDDVSHHSINDTSHHSTDDTSHHSTEDGRKHILDDMKHHSASDMRHLNDHRQYNFGDLRQQNIVDLTPHNIEDVRHYSTDDTIRPTDEDGRSHSQEVQQFQNSNDIERCSTEDMRNQNIDDVGHNTEDKQCRDISYRQIPDSGTNKDAKNESSPYLETFSIGSVESVRHHSMPYVEGLSGSSQTATTTTCAQTQVISTSESSYYPDKYEQCVFQHQVPPQIKDECRVDENRIQTVQSTRQNSNWNENWNEEPWERQISPGPIRRRGQPYFRPRFPDYQHRYQQQPYQPYGRRNNYRPRFPVPPPFNPHYPPPTHLIPGGRGNFPPRF